MVEQKGYILIWCSLSLLLSFFFFLLLRSIQEGDRIVLLSQVNEEWYRGSIGNSEGMFPTSFVRIVVPLVQLEKSDQSPDRVTPGSYSKAVALYAFRGETDEDLSLLVRHSISTDPSLPYCSIYPPPSLSIFYLLHYYLTWTVSICAGRRHCPSDWIAWQRLALRWRLSIRSTRPISRVFCPSRILSQNETNSRRPVN